MTGTPSGTDRHLPVLVLLVRTWGALSLLVGVAMLLMALGAMSLLFDPTWPSDRVGTGLTAGAFAFVFGMFGAFAVAFGAAHLWAGNLLQGHRPLGRLLMLALSLVNLLVLPFGTVFAGYAFWVLMTHDARTLFGAAHVDTIRSDA